MNRIARTAGDLEAEARTWEREDLIRIWENLQARQPVKRWEAGKAFEYLVVRAFEIDGLRARWPYAVTYRQKLGIVEQNDGLVYLGERAFLLESKDHTDALAIEAVAKLRFRLESRPPGTMSVLFTARSFSLATEVFSQFAAPLNVILWRGQDLDYALRRGSMASGLQAKFEAATERGIPLFTLE